MKHIEITRATYIHGVPAAVGETFHVEDETAALAVECKKAIIVEAPKDAPIEKPKPKFTKVEPKKAE